MQVKITLECRGVTEFSSIVESPEHENLPDVLGVFVDQYRRAKPVSPLLADNMVLRFVRLPNDRRLG